MNIQNELGVIIAFSQACQEKGWKINHIQAEFPDAIIQDANGDTYRAEFEFCASNFKIHRHDLCQCDVIICWENDWADCPLTVWSMQNWNDHTIAICDRKDLLIASLTIENERLKRRVSRLASQKESKTTTQAIHELNERQINLLALLIENPDMNYTELGTACDVSRTTAKSDTETLIAAGRLQRNGNGWEVKQ